MAGESEQNQIKWVQIVVWGTKTSQIFKMLDDAKHRSAWVSLLPIYAYDGEPFKYINE